MSFNKPVGDITGMVVLSTTLYFRLDTVEFETFGETQITRDNVKNQLLMLFLPVPNVMAVPMELDDSG